MTWTVRWNSGTEHFNLPVRAWASTGGKNESVSVCKFGLETFKTFCERPFAEKPEKENVDVAPTGKISVNAHECECVSSSWRHDSATAHSNEPGQQRSWHHVRPVWRMWSPLGLATIVSNGMLGHDGWEGGSDMCKSVIGGPYKMIDMESASVNCRLFVKIKLTDETASFPVRLARFRATFVPILDLSGIGILHDIISSQQHFARVPKSDQSPP